MPAKLVWNLWYTEWHWDSFFSWYEGRSESKERFFHTKIFIDNRKETEYAGFITQLHLLLHRVTLDSEALVVP